MTRPGRPLCLSMTYPAVGAPVPGQQVLTTFNVVGSDYAMAQAAEQLADLRLGQCADDVLIVGRTEAQHWDHYYHIEYVLEYEGVDVLGPTLNMALPLSCCRCQESEVGLSDANMVVQELPVSG